MSLLQTNNTRQAAWVASGSLFSFGFALVSSMILSRFFNKGDYGTYKQVMYVYSSLLTIFTLGLPHAYSFFLPRVNVQQARDLILKLMKIFFLLGAVFSLFLFFCAGFIADLLRNHDLVRALRLFSVTPFLMLPTMGLEGILSTYKKNQYNAVYAIVSRLVMLVCVCVPVVFFNGGYCEAIIGFSVSSLVSFLMSLYLQFLPVKNMGNEKCDISYSEIFRFSLPMLAASLWGLVLHSSDQFFISRYFGKQVFAEFSNGSMELPFVGMIVGTCSTVLSPLISKLSYSGCEGRSELFSLWKSVFEKSSLLVYPLVIYCMFFSDIVMELLYGQQYQSSGVYFIIKSFYSYFAVIMYAPMVVNMGKVRYYSNTHMIAAVSIVLLEYLSVKLFSSPYSISVVSVLVQIGKSIALLYAVSTYFGVRMYELFPIKTIALILIPSALFLSIEHYAFVNILQMNLLLTLFGSFLLYVAVFLLFSHRANLNYRSIIEPLMHK